MLTKLSQPLLEPLADIASSFALTPQDPIASNAVPDLLQPYEDGYTSLPGTPVDMPLAGISSWGYPASTALTPELPMLSCDSYFEPTMFSPHAHVFS